jgi:hypothetical protein
MRARLSATVSMRLAQFGGQILGADLARQLQAQPSLDLGVALGDVDQQFGQPLRAQGGQIGRRQGLSRSRALHRRQRSSPVRAFGAGRVAAFAGFL